MLPKRDASAPAPETRRYLIAVAILGLALAALMIGTIVSHSPVLEHGVVNPIGQDFINYWGAPQLMAKIQLLFSVPDYTTALSGLYGQPITNHNWSYPLYTLFFLSPFAALDYIPALVLWSVLGLAVYLWSVRCAQPLPGYAWVMLLVAPATLMNLMLGQNGFYTAALSLGALVLLERRPVLAGVLIGLLCVKPQLCLLWPVILLATGSWRAIVVACLTFAALLLLSVMVHGPAAWTLYFAVTAPFQWQLGTTFDPQHLLPYQLMMPGVIAALRMLQVSLPVTLAIQAIVALGVMGAVAYGFRTTKAIEVRALLLAAGGLLVAPYSFHYDMVLLSAALVLYWLRHPPATWPQRLLGMAAYTLPATVYLFNAAHLPLGPIILGLVFLAAVRTVQETSLTIDPS